MKVPYVDKLIERWQKRQRKREEEKRQTGEMAVRTAEALGIIPAPAATPALPRVESREPVRKEPVPTSLYSARILLATSRIADSYSRRQKPCILFLGDIAREAGLEPNKTEKQEVKAALLAAWVITPFGNERPVARRTSYGRLRVFPGRLRQCTNAVSA